MVLRIELCRNFQITIFFITCQGDSSKIFPLQNQYQARKWGKIIQNYIHGNTNLVFKSNQNNTSTNWGWLHVNSQVQKKIHPIHPFRIVGLNLQLFTLHNPLNAFRVQLHSVLVNGLICDPNLLKPPPPFFWQIPKFSENFQVAIKYLEAKKQG
jgi:hypothetical protein